MRCWICGKEGNTGEHLVKASDLRNYFELVTQKKPLYRHTSSGKVSVVQSIKSKYFKSKAKLCNRCNSALTQPYDRAWERISSYIKKDWTQLIKAKQLNLKKVFPGCSNKSAVDVHLYFVKIFGCRIVEDSIPIDISIFSTSLLARTPHPHIYIKITLISSDIKHKVAGYTPIQAMNVNGNTTFATWFYHVGSLAINVIYNIIPNNQKALKNAWHPITDSKLLRLETL